MSWNCIKCEASNSDSHVKCEVCNFERFYTKIELDAELAKAIRSFQPPIGENKKQKNHWLIGYIFLCFLVLISTIIGWHYYNLSNEKSIRLARLRESHNDTSKQLNTAKKWLQSVCFVGPKDRSGDGGYININEGLYFDVFTHCKLQSVDVYPKGQGYITVELFDTSRNVINNKRVYVYGGRRNKVNLEFTLNTGKNYLLKAKTNAVVRLYRNISMAKKFPYELSNVIRITNSTLGEDYYYFFYNWQISMLC